MAVVKYTLEPNAELTEGQIAEIELAGKKPVTYDEDCPELMDEQLNELAVIARQQRQNRKRGIVSIRLPQQTIEKVKKLGNGYTSILSRMIDLCINDKDLLARCL